MIELNLNEIRVISKVPDATIAVRADLYDIESINTTEIRTQSVATATGNEHTVQKFSNESTIATKIPGGTIELIATSNCSQLIQRPSLLVGFVIM